MKCLSEVQFFKDLILLEYQAESMCLCSVV